MRFLMFICPDRSIEMGPEDRARIGPTVETWVSEMERRHVRVMGAVLAPGNEATTVRSTPDGVRVGSGASVATGASIAGFNVIECADVEEAVEVSSTHPMARFGTIELRAVVNE
jgi:hypothetical protein